MRTHVLGLGCLRTTWHCSAVGARTQVPIIRYTCGGGAAWSPTQAFLFGIPHRPSCCFCPGGPVHPNTSIQTSCLQHRIILQDELRLLSECRKCTVHQRREISLLCRTCALTMVCFLVSELYASHCSPCPSKASCCATIFSSCPTACRDGAMHAGTTIKSGTTWPTERSCTVFAIGIAVTDLGIGRGSAVGGLSRGKHAPTPSVLLSTLPGIRPLRASPLHRHPHRVSRHCRPAMRWPRGQCLRRFRRDRLPAPAEPRRIHAIPA